MNPFLAWTPQRTFLGCAAATLVIAAIMAILVDAGGENQLEVFGSFWASGWAAANGLNPYGQYPLTWVTDIGVTEYNLNPPTLLPLFQLFALFDATTAARTWTMLSAVLFVGLAGALMADRRFQCGRHQIMWVFFAPAFINTLAIGQIYVLLFVLAAAGWLCLKHGRPLVGGVFIGLLVLAKPNFAVWPALLLLAGHWRPSLSAAVVTMSVTGLSLWVYGVETYRQWLAAAVGDPHIFFTTEVSITGYVTRMGLPELAKPASVALIVAVAVWVWRRRFAALDTSGLALVVAILASPLAWLDYALVLVPALLERPWSRTLKVAALLMSVPILLPFLAIGGPTWLVVIAGTVYFGALWLILAAFIARLRAPAAVTGSAYPTEA